MSDIRVFVTFPDSTCVFSGETLRCKITFKNVSQPPGSPRPFPPAAPTVDGQSTAHPAIKGGAVRVKPAIRPVQNLDRRKSGQASPGIPQQQQQGAGRGTPGHKPSLSLSVPAARSPASPRQNTQNGRPVHKHKRSISIVSVGSDAGIESGTSNRGPDSPMRVPPVVGQGRGRAHKRSASLQIQPRRGGGLGSAPPSAGLGSARSPHPPTPMIVETPNVNGFKFSSARTPATPPTPVSPPNPRHSRSHSVNPAFKFPPTPINLSSTENLIPRTPTRSQGTNSAPQLSRKVSQIDLKSPSEEQDYEHITTSRALAAFNISGDTPRSSSEFYSVSNNSTETLASEYAPRAPPTAGLLRPAHSRRHSLLSVESKPPETLMMGYAHVMASFVIDGSLIEGGIFDEVKKKGVVGTHHGGGVVGLETSKADGGFLGGWGFGSLTGLLGGNNMSSIAEMKSIAGTKSVPILSTPQSILFVDLRLAPGESKSYMYKFALPSGLPPSHKGKAIKITYNLVVGTQRPGKGVQQPTVIEVPFRVFGNVHGDGSLDTYDLSHPIILLRDEASVIALDSETSWPAPTPPMPEPKHQSSSADFMAYVDDLLAAKQASPAASLLSPSLAGMGSKRFSIYEDEAASSKDAIELAILGAAARGTQCFMFDVARNGRRVATVTLSRPAYKLGECVTAAVDFSVGEVPCYHIIASLESSEIVSPQLALRSPQSIQRATRRVYSQHSESTLFSKRVVFSPAVPATATPGFCTSAVESKWVLRIEFVTARQEETGAGLLENTFADDRGALFEPRQLIWVESFEACIPVKVYANGNEVGGGAAAAMGRGFTV